MDEISISILLPTLASFPLSAFNSPENFLKPPLWRPVTFEPTNSMLEFSGAMAYERAADAEALAGWVASVGAFVLELTLAAGTLSAGLEQPAKNAMGRSGSRWLTVFMRIDVFGSMCG